MNAPRADSESSLVWELRRSLARLELAGMVGTHEVARLSAGLPVELGFLLGTRKYECNVECFPAGSTLHIQASRTLQDDNGMGVFECRLSGPGIEVFARLNVFRPPQVASYLQEEFQEPQP